MAVLQGEFPTAVFLYRYRYLNSCCSHSLIWPPDIHHLVLPAVLQVPLSFSVLASGSVNNASFPSGVQLLEIAALPGAGAMGVATNGLPIVPAPDNHNAFFCKCATEGAIT